MDKVFDKLLTFLEAVLLLVTLRSAQSLTFVYEAHEKAAYDALSSASFGNYRTK